MRQGPLPYQIKIDAGSALGQAMSPLKKAKVCLNCNEIRETNLLCRNSSTRTLVNHLLGFSHILGTYHYAHATCESWSGFNSTDPPGPRISLTSPIYDTNVRVSLLTTRTPVRTGVRTVRHTAPCVYQPETHN